MTFSDKLRYLGTIHLKVSLGTMKQSGFQEFFSHSSAKETTLREIVISPYIAKGMSVLHHI